MDIFRKNYMPLTPENQGLILKIKLHAELLAELLVPIKNREMSLAMTNLEQSIMWATKAVAIENEKQGEK